MSEPMAGKPMEPGLLRAATAAFVLALAVRGAAAWFSGAAQPNEIRYVTIARGIISAQGYSGLDKRFPDIIQPPVYTMMLAGVLLSGGPELALARGVSALMGALLVFPVALLTRRLHGVKSARRASFLAAFYPLLVHNSSAALTESTFTLLVLCAVLTLWRALDAEEGSSPWISSLAAGGLFGASFLTRPEGLAFLAVAMLVLIVVCRFGGVAWRATLPWALCLAGGFAIVLFPYLLWLHGTTGHWMLAPKAMLAWVHNSLILEGQKEDWKEPFGSVVFNERVKFGLNRERTAIRSQELFAAASGSSLAGILDSDEPGIDLIKPRAMLSLLLGNLRKLYDSMKEGYVIPPLLLVFAGIGLTSKRWSGVRGRSSLIVLAFLLGSLSFLLTFYMPRYLNSTVCFGLPWAAAGWTHAESWLLASLSAAGAIQSGVSRQLVKTAMGIVVTVFTGVYLLGALETTRGLWAEHRELGRWLGAMEGGDHVVMSATPVVSYYAHAKFEVLPYAELDDVLSYARHQRVEFLVADTHEITTHRPQLESLLSPHDAHPGLTLVKVLYEGTPDAIVLYRLSDGYGQTEEGTKVQRP